ncbi:hypothetical protein [Vogesella oryzae]|uniref:hypothetical protein n=1 Tax=Vogesella oryzae TaxID=1735285 RepID=UPI00158232D9|nr:hypothetical protein [Vogesella oryzae]
MSDDKTTNKIIQINTISKKSGDYIAECPHCKDIYRLIGNDLSAVRGTRYLHSACDGWLVVSKTARFIRNLP